MNVKYTHGKLCVPNQKNLLELPLLLPEKFNLWKEQYQQNNIVYSWVSSKIICVRSGTQTFLFLQRFSWRILYFYISAAPRATGWMVFHMQSSCSKEGGFKEEVEQGGLSSSQGYQYPKSQTPGSVQSAHGDGLWGMYTKVLLTGGTEKTAGFTSPCFKISFWDRSFFRKVTENPGKCFQPLPYLIYAHQPVLSLLTEPTFHNSTHNLRVFHI